MLEFRRRQQERNRIGGKEGTRPELGWTLGMTEERKNEITRIQKGIQTMEERLARHNLLEAPPEREVGLFRRVLGFLRRGETAPAVMAGIRGENLGRAYWQSTFGAEPLERIGYADVFSEMGWRPDTRIGRFIRGTVGLAADILLDPKTYLTFGVGGAIKLKTKLLGKTAELGLNRKGTRMLRQYVGEAGETKGRKKMAQFLAKEKDLNQYVVSDGLKFMGQQIPLIGRREVVTAPFKIVDWIARHTPIVKPIYETAEKWGRKAFVPFDEISKLPAMKVIIGRRRKEIEDGVAFKELSLRNLRSTRAEQMRGMEHIMNLSKNAKKTLPEEKELGKILSNAMESKNKRTTGFKVLDDILDFARKKHKEMFFLERKYGITEKELPNYLKHVLTKEGREAIRKGIDIVSNLSKPLRVRLTKPRKIQGTIAEINKEWMEKYGHKLFEEDFFKIFALRNAEHVQNVRMYEFFTEVARRWGVIPETYWTQSIHPITGKVTRKKIARPLTVPVNNGIKFVESTVPQLKGVLLPEPIVKMIDEYNKLFTNEEAANAFLRFYDRLLRFWKVSVTGIWPAFHVRNITGSIWNNWLRGLTNPIRYKQADDVAMNRKGEITTELGTKYNYQQLGELMDDKGLMTQPGQLDTMRTVEDLLERGFLKKAADTPLAITEAVEKRVRGALFIDRLIKGDTPDEAAKKVYETLFDYAPEGLTAFERNVMRRTMPFYRWCMSEDTEVLTQEGFKNYKNLKKTDKLLTWNKNNKELEWQKLEDFAVFDFDGRIMNLKNSRINFLFTPEHKWYIENDYNKKILERYSHELKQDDKIPLTGNYLEEKSILTTQEAAILGWIVTDGYFRKRGNCYEMVIYQSSKKYLKEILDLLEIKTLNRKPHPQTGVYCINVPQKFVKKIIKFFKTKKDLPTIVGKLSRKSAISMWNAMFRAEGSVSLKKHFSKFEQYNQDVLDAFQILTLLVGKSTNIKNNRCYVKRHKFIKVAKQIGYENYSGKVWCPVTKNGTWIARRNGATIITGNSRGNTPYQLEMLAKQPGKFAVLPKFEKMFDDMADGGRQRAEQERSLMPHWMAEMFTLRLPGAVPKYIQMDLPASDLNNLPIGASGWRRIASSLSPFLKYPIERLAGKDLFFGGELWNPNLPRDLQTRSTILNLEALPEFLRNYLGFHKTTREDPLTGKPKTTYEMDARKVHTMRTFLGRFYSSFARALDDEMSVFDKISHLITGTPIREVNFAREELRKMYDRQRQLRELVGYYRQRGIIPATRDEKLDETRDKMRRHLE